MPLFFLAMPRQKTKPRRSTTRPAFFATHALVIEQRPLDTAIVLSILGAVDETTDNGYLQAWEIYEQFRLDANLVTLSGCETDLGTALTGEGLMGLSRAFQYAGASTVLASLWNINDRQPARS